MGGQGEGRGLRGSKGAVVGQRDAYMGNHHNNKHSLVAHTFSTCSMHLARTCVQTGHKYRRHDLPTLTHSPASWHEHISNSADIGTT